MESIVAVLIAGIISMLSVKGFVNWVDQGMQNVQVAATSGQMLQFDNAATQYIQDNSSTLVATTVGAASSVSATTLVNAGYLPQGFTGTNPFKQTWELQVSQPVSGQLQGVVTSQGGNAIPTANELVKIAAQVGAQGGFIPYANQAGSTMQATNAYGAYGSWQVPMAAYTNPGSGHLASLLSFNANSGNSEYLYRVQVAGHPELNAMQTNMSMTDVGGTAHSITGASWVSTGTLTSTAAGTQAAPSAALAASSVTAFKETGVGGTVGLTGNNGQSVYLAGNNGEFDVMNSAWSLTLLAVDGNGKVTSQGGYTAKTGDITAVAGNVSAASAVSAGTSLAVGPGATQGPSGTGTFTSWVMPGGAAVETACSNPGATAVSNSDTMGILLSCQKFNGSYLWMPVGGPSLRQGLYNVSNSFGWTVPVPTCPAGSIAQIVVMPQETYIDTTATYNITVSPAVTPPAGSYWTVAITDGTGAAVAAPAPGVSAQAETYCSF
ncbi:shufflon system plasmid conjugative transfer pilus tip adhesin PilV [Paraburkholderia sp. J8-2]|uniref:shufflon system plasmid conjugative transfer pilus tip adhesin PilV n=1 Tax=Paraburkholderia sp. J8-2 TaxID=2805440 RepID=UPI002AB6962A|nr:shufflon system plasmid conjugative transfer pilus tip adhesin PilV [Paraburkholderia sp. J8-2]